MKKDKLLKIAIGLLSMVAVLQIIDIALKLIELFKILSLKYEAFKVGLKTHI